MQDELKDARVKPTRWQYFVAHGWPMRLWLALHVVGCVAFAASRLLSVPQTKFDLEALAEVVWILVCAALAGLPAGIVTAVCLLAPSMRAWGDANGAPYRPG